MMRFAMNELLSLSTPLADVLIVVPHMMMPNVLLGPVFWVAPAAISRLRTVLLLAPFPLATLASQMAAVAAAVLLLRTVRSRALPAPPWRPSMMTLSAPSSLITAPVIEPSMIRGPPTGRIVTLVYEADPTPLAVSAAAAVSVVLPQTSMLTAPV